MSHQHMIAEVGAGLYHGGAPRQRGRLRGSRPTDGKDASPREAPLCMARCDTLDLQKFNKTQPVAARHGPSNS